MLYTCYVCMLDYLLLLLFVAFILSLLGGKLCPPSIIVDVQVGE